MKEKENSIPKSNANRVLPALAALLILGATIVSLNNASSLTEIATRAEGKISDKALYCRNMLASLEHFEVNAFNEDLAEQYAKENIAVYMYKADSLVFWNNSQVPVPLSPRAFSNDQGIVRLVQGYYLYVCSRNKKGLAVALCLIKPAHEIHNNYLRNDFAEWTGIPKEVDISTKTLDNNIVSIQGQKLFGLKGNEKYYYSQRLDDLTFILFLAGFSCLLLALLNRIKDNPQRNTLLSVGIMVLLRIIMICFKWPASFYRSTFYDVHLFGNANSWANAYLGDIFWNSLILLFVSGAFYFGLQRRNKKWHDNLNAALVLLLIFLLYNQFSQSLISLVINSTLSFDFLNLFNFKFPAFIGLVAIGLYALGLFVSLRKFIFYFHENNARSFMVFLACILLPCVLQWVISTSSRPFENFWLPVIALPLFFIERSNKTVIQLALGLHVLLISILTAILLNFYIDKNQKQDLELLSTTLGEKKDPILENEFAGMPAKIQKDNNFNNLLSLLPESRLEIEASLKQKYFSGYFERYNLDFSLFDERCRPLLSPRDPVLVNEGFFDDRIKLGSDTVQQGLFFVKGYKKNAQYIAKIKLGIKKLYVLMEPRHFEEFGSFPDLLLDQSLQKHEKLKNFSYVVYRSQQMTNRYGDFNYPLFFPDSVSLQGSDKVWMHHYFYPDELTQIVVSQKGKTWRYYFTFNSYLLLFFSLSAFFSYVLYAALFTSRFKSSSLTRRIQAIIIVLLLMSISAVGFTSGKLVNAQFEAENKKQLEEKSAIIISELTSQFKPEELFDEGHKELVTLKLKEYSRLFNTPISLFTSAGRLFNTSELKLYDLGLAAPLANPKAFVNFKKNRSSSENVTEKAGTLNYSSHYTPLPGIGADPLGYLNLPYFARQGDLANELSGIISAFINVYVILFVISILAGLVLSGYITRPLRLIREQLSGITLGKTNEKIAWRNNDEIGGLVSEYNQMLVKLENSASLLAKSERESAWREMAKQVAHEIKNPLTPMKLNLQYLQRLMESDPVAFKEHFGKASAGIIEQIDSLAAIAGEFSSFARLPETRLDTVNLREVIDSALLIFEGRKKIVVKNNIPGTEILVKGDREQCLRVFNNIFTNAIQAVGGTEEPQIVMGCETIAGKTVVSIRDNGYGIAPDLKEKIFTPNFTTRSAGSGLGLAMVKNIMESSGGRIWFESEPGKGTVFYLEFDRI